MKQLEELKNKIIKAVPDILELKFGRSVKFEYNDKMEEGIFGNICETSSGIIWLKERYLENGYKERNNMVQYKFIDCKGKFNGTGWLRCEIIGRPITLEDVLVALDKNYRGSFLISFAEKYESGKIKITCDGDSVYWQLNKNLEEQSKETINFLKTRLYERNTL
jgi:hypothetical protein